MDIKDAITSNGIDPPREVDQFLVRKSEGFLVCSMAISRPGSVFLFIFITPIDAAQKYFLRIIVS